MDIQQIKLQEKLNTGTTQTNNKEFEKNGYLVLNKLWDPQELYFPLPCERGQLNYWGKQLDQFNLNPVETQVVGSLARYWHPQYRDIHTKIRLKLEKVLGKFLYNTYYYDRFYFPGQELKKHVDRDACEISVTVHVGTNLQGNSKNWPIWIKTPDVYKDNKKNIILTAGEDHKVNLEPGDGMIYKGCERPHWRESMPGVTKNIKLFGKKEQLYYHQIFFHYVLQDGQRAHCAFDAAS